MGLLAGAGCSESTLGGESLDGRVSEGGGRGRERRGRRGNRVQTGFLRLTFRGQGTGRVTPCLRGNRRPDSHVPPFPGWVGLTVPPAVRRH